MLYTDTSSNTYYGKCEYGNFSIFQPTLNWFRCSNDYSQLETLLKSLYSNVTTVKSATALLLKFKLENYYCVIDINQQTGSAQVSISLNQDFSQPFILAQETISQINFEQPNNQFTIVANQKAFSIFITFSKSITCFCSFSLIENLNQIPGYYISNPKFKIATILNSKIYHYIGEQQKQVYQYDYQIICADNQMPSAKWLTTLLLYENNQELGIPCIGNYNETVIIGTGTFTIGKPTKTIFPPINYYLPVSKYSTNRFILIKCLYAN